MTARGFTLIETLIALVILGVVATFAIPKVLDSMGGQQYNAVGKEVITAISNAFDSYAAENSLTANTDTTSIFQYVNYVRQDTATRIDDRQTSTYVDCGTGSGGSYIWCYRLHSNAMLWWYGNPKFNSTATTAALEFYVDPDGKYSGSTTGAGKSLQFFVYYTGHIRTRGKTLSNTCHSGGCYASPWAAADPPWFSW